jgi:4-diphosphocytidyl-2-C-methyl-D-erythritol kinase
MAAVRLLAFAKINLSLEVLNRRPDGFHNLRTIFQTITLHDTIRVEGGRARSTKVEVVSDVDIPGENLIVRAAHAVLEATGLRAALRFDLKKNIPMGGGLGGGSTDAAAVLLALPALLKRPLAPERLMELGAALGSDVPFFLLGGTALGVGRGNELYPLPDAPAVHGLLVSPAVHVATADAYGALGRAADVPVALSSSPAERIAQALANGRPWGERAVNDFEPVVFAKHPEIGAIKARLARKGARPALMTGSGAAVFGLFATPASRHAAASVFGATRVFNFSLLSGRRYRSIWRKALQGLC